MGKNKGKKKPKTEFQIVRSSMAKLENELKAQAEQERKEAKGNDKKK